jgi:preprotein translocase subunit SecE
MPSSVKDEGEKAMTNTASGAADEPRGNRPPPPSTTKESDRGFFTVYKSGQGYWTRMGTAGAGALIGILIAHFFYEYLPVWLNAAGVAQEPAVRIAIGVAAGFLVLFALFVFWIMNKPGNADFLIATDSEMKKVNWTTRKELIGSTRVVISFMFMLAAILFVVDMIFSYFFWLIDVLQVRPY